MRSNIHDSSAVPALVPVSHEGVALPFKLLLPAFFSVTVVVVLPLLFSLYTSFTSYRLIEPETIWHHRPAQLSARICQRGLLGRVWPHRAIPDDRLESGTGAGPRHRAVAQ
jgi:hypothetical protein